MFQRSSKRIGNQYNIRTIFKSKYTLRSSLMRTRLETDPQQTAQCICCIPSECGRSYIGETAMCLCEHRHNLKQGLLEKSKLAQHAYEEVHRVGWDDARILEIEINSRYRKYKELAHGASGRYYMSSQIFSVPLHWCLCTWFCY
jgi:hypothetical protein